MPQEFRDQVLELRARGEQLSPLIDQKFPELRAWVEEILNLAIPEGVSPEVLRTTKQTHQAAAEVLAKISSATTARKVVDKIREIPVKLGVVLAALEEADLVKVRAILPKVREKFLAQGFETDLKFLLGNIAAAQRAPRAERASSSQHITSQGLLRLIRVMRSGIHFRKTPLSPREKQVVGMIHQVLREEGYTPLPPNTPAFPYPPSE